MQPDYHFLTAVRSLAKSIPLDLLNIIRPVTQGTDFALST
jgi:hypothetical protein